MKLSFVIGGAIGYVLGAKAGRERYEQIVAASRRFAGSQTVQTTAGVLQAQLDTVSQRARNVLMAKVGGHHGQHGRADLATANGYHG